MVAVTDFTREALSLLRDGSHFQWSTVALLVLCMYVYAVEVERRRWDIVLAGLAFWLMDWFNEIANSLVLHFSDRAALWTVTGDTSYLILVGLCVEISLMFLVSGVVYVKQLPEDPAVRWLGIPNRWALAGVLSALAVLVEVALHSFGVFHWEYWWWDTPWGLPTIWAFGYMTFFIAAFKVYDAPSDRRRLQIVGALAALDAIAIALFGPVLGWI